ncbi:MAG: DUF84 family protein, partial [Candidatus Aureabacteria bacterium]|nr:DUF84 family protein [Candidatus Auribacterota bacterium]
MRDRPGSRLHAASCTLHASFLVAVGSTNPVKRRAVAAASGVSSTPLSNEETIAGARRRAQAARRAARARWGVGLEGGMA